LLCYNAQDFTAVIVKIVILLADTIVSEKVQPSFSINKMLRIVKYWRARLNGVNPDDHNHSSE
jgi:hypothetical protein